MRFLGQLAVACIAAGILAAPPGAGAASGSVVAAGDGVSWLSIAGGYARVVLTVSCPDGTSLREEFAPGSSPQLAGPLADGLYVYELRYLPLLDDAGRDALARARESGDLEEVERLRGEGRLPQGPVVQSGSFRILAGGLSGPGEEEEPSARGARP